MADRLYGLPPGDFTAGRAAEAAAAKAAGAAGLAREIGALRKPTVSAWAVNRASREHPAELADLLALGGELRAAWAAGDADALAELTRRRGEVTGRLARLLRQGLSGAAAAEVDQTLDAAVADAEAAELLRRGRLVKALSYSGFAAPAGGGTLSRTGTRRSVKPSPEQAEQERQAAGERRARELAEAEAQYLEWRDTLALAVQELEKRADKAAKLEKKLAKARKRENESRQRVEVARREERLARQRLEKAR
ncbi:hypothetical protein [Nonomuraea typhae]|uniref:Transposase n=1 Tax=Nonomuraea typhae TaxID=2603600 RepID=A0ABW7Z5G9_9ACTN